MQEYALKSAPQKRGSKKAVKPHDMNFQQTPRERSSTLAAIRNPPRFQRLPIELIVPIFAFETRPTH
ncbi:hypothetical protein [Paraburkholderia kururiensis]|uniref:hypothetical protein n=1 Tax=Paraburkholderia kururiensis TaxID=984307 RepID=UPI0039A6A030